MQRPIRSSPWPCHITASCSALPLLFIMLLLLKLQPVLGGGRQRHLRTPGEFGRGVLESDSVTFFWSIPLQKRPWVCSKLFWESRIFVIWVNGIPSETKIGGLVSWMAALFHCRCYSGVSIHGTLKFDCSVLPDRSACKKEQHGCKDRVQVWPSRTNILDLWPGPG